MSQGAFLKDWAGLDVACMYRQFLQLPHQREEIIPTCICMAESLRRPPETITTLLIGYTPTQNKKLKKRNQSKLKVHLAYLCWISESFKYNSKCTLHRSSRFTNTTLNTHIRTHTLQHMKDEVNQWKQNCVLKNTDSAYNLSPLWFHSQVWILDDKVLWKISI